MLAESLAVVPNNAYPLSGSQHCKGVRQAMSRLDGKVALISGGARGIGAETARLMCEAGARVTVGDILTEQGRETVATIKASGGDAHFTELDVTSERAWSAAVAETMHKFGRLDILVNNAGMFLGRDFEEASLADWHKLVAVNMTGVFLGTKFAAPALRESGRTSRHGSAIVNLSSIAGIVGSPLDALYSMTKGGVTLFTKSTALAFARKGDRIRVNSVHPGVIETDMGAQTFVRRMAVMGSNDLAKAQEATRHMHPIGRLGTPEDVARTIVFLASDDARFMTGSALVVDGGVTAQ
jgi:NAD(P)-dependent dehydrogenase (short-subunit alcohol dehydrogenase family)